MKFDDENDEYIYLTAAADGESIGDVAGPFGWAARVSLDSQIDQDKAAMDRYDGADLFIVRENSDGIVMIRPFHEQAAHEKAWAMLEQGIALHEAEITDEEAREALDGYLQAAEYTGVDEQGGPLDGRGLSWTMDAQDKARADVIDFITSNVEDIREFLKVTRHGWLQVGIDFSLTRNGQGAGFWDRGAGEVGDRLTDASKPHGEASVFVNENEEMDFS